MKPAIFRLQVHDVMIALAGLIIVAAAGASLPPQIAPPVARPPHDPGKSQPPPALPPQPRLICEQSPCGLVVGRTPVPAYQVAGPSGSSTLIRPGTAVVVGGVTRDWIWITTGSGVSGFIERKRLDQGRRGTEASELYRAYQVRSVLRQSLAPAAVTLYGDKTLRHRIAVAQSGEPILVLEENGDRAVVAIGDGHGGRVIGRLATRTLTSPPPVEPASPSDVVAEDDPPTEDGPRAADEPAPLPVDVGTDVAPLLAAGQKAFIAEDYATALDLAEQVLVADPKNSTARRLAGLAACENGDRGAGLRHARKLAGPARAKVEEACGGAAAPDCINNPVDPRCAQ